LTVTALGFSSVESVLYSLRKKLLLNADYLC
jgi:hypothetical protein